MKKITLMILTVLCSYTSFSQTACPTSIKTSGQSTPSNPIFTVPNGNNGCSAGWPTTIIVNGTLTYTFDGCTGGNLSYILDPATQTPPASYEMTVDFGGGLICPYNASGAYDPTLSSQDLSLNNEVSIFPNPVANGKDVKIDFGTTTVGAVQLFNLNGQLIEEFDIKGQVMQLSTDNLNSGIYLLKITSVKDVFTRKLIIE